MLKKKNIFKIIVLLLIMVMSIGVLTGCGNTEEEKEKEETVEAYEEPIKNFVEGLEAANSEKFLKAFPEFLAEYMADSITDEDLKDMLADAEEEYGANIKMSYKVTDKTEISEEDLKEMQEEMATYYDEEVTVSKGYELEVEITTKGDDSEETETDTLEVYELDGKWCILGF